MNYKEAFAVDSIHYTERKKQSKEKDSEFILNNFDYYNPELVKDFYLKYFINELLFVTDIIELESFLLYHYDYCDDPDLYFSLLELKVVPKTQELIENAQINIQGGGYYNEKNLEDGFTESNGTIQNYTYDYPSMNHRVAFLNLQNDFNKRIQIINAFLEERLNKSAPKPLKWIAGPSQLGVIIKELIDKGYMEAETRKGDVNFALLSRNLFKAFDIKEGDSFRSLEMYLSTSNKKHIAAKKTFEDRGFSIPPADYT